MNWHWLIRDWMGRFWSHIFNLPIVSPTISKDIPPSGRSNWNPMPVVRSAIAWQCWWTIAQSRGWIVRWHYFKPKPQRWWRKICGDRKSRRFVPIIPKSIRRSNVPNRISIYCVSRSILPAPPPIILALKGLYYLRAYRGSAPYLDGMQSLLPVRFWS